MRISQYFKGRNFMTPEVIEYGEIAPNGDKRIFYELSTGTGFMSDEQLWGLTFMSVDSKGHIEKENNLNQCFSNMVDVDLTLKNLGRKYISDFVKEL